MPLTYTLIHHRLKGGKLKVGDLKGLLNAAYKPHDKVGDFVLDKDLSSKTSKVYTNPNTKQTVVAHRGTSGISDWFNNALYALGGKKLYKLTPRYKEAEKVQNEAIKKYGADTISTIGHSSGGLQAELLGSPTHEIITLNKATRPFSNVKHINEYDVRTQNDIVSALNPLQNYSENDLVIPSKSRNILSEHGTDTLDRLDPNLDIGAD
jgi:hypothetical protein